MKKLFAIVLVFCLLPTFAFACEDVLMVKQESQTTVFYDCSYWAITNENLIAGMKSPTEAVEIRSIQNVQGVYVRGISSNEIIRSHSVIKVICAEETVVGLTKLTNVAVTIYPQHYGTVVSIVGRRLGEGVQVSAESIVACTTWRMDNHIAHIFFSSGTERFEVGSITFNNGNNTAILYAGDFDGNGTLELGFAPGKGEPASKPTPEPEPVKEPEPTVIVHNWYITEQTTQHVTERITQNVCNKTETTIVQDNRQVNINSTVQNNQTQVVNINNTKDCQKQKKQMGCMQF